MSPQAALTLLRLADEVHSGKRKLPPEIEDLRERVQAAKRNAYLFLITLRVVDQGLVDRAVALMIQLDDLYAEWAESESGSFAH